MDPKGGCRLGTGHHRTAQVHYFVPNYKLYSNNNLIIQVLQCQEGLLVRWGLGHIPILGEGLVDLLGAPCQCAEYGVCVLKCVECDLCLLVQ